MKGEPTQKLHFCTFVKGYRTNSHLQQVCTQSRALSVLSLLSLIIYFQHFFLTGVRLKMIGRSISVEVRAIIIGSLENGATARQILTL